MFSSRVLCSIVDQSTLVSLWYFTGFTTAAAATSYILSKDTYQLIRNRKNVQWNDSCFRFDLRWTQNFLGKKQLIGAHKNMSLNFNTRSNISKNKENYNNWMQVNLLSYLFLFYFKKYSIEKLRKAQRLTRVRARKTTDIPN